MVHLAGESLFALRWSEEKKRAIRESRELGTRLLAETLARLERPPRVLVSASAIGFYGDRGDESLDEDSAPGEGFLADVCRAWEAAAEPARSAGIRVVNLRLGVVLSPRRAARWGRCSRRSGSLSAVGSAREGNGSRGSPSTTCSALCRRRSSAPSKAP